MLYLIKSYGKNNRVCYKIGFTNNCDNRISQYKNANPFCEVVKIREGTEETETCIHVYLDYLGLLLDRNSSKEWYKDDKKVIEVFNSDLDELKRLIWDNRDKIIKKEKNGGGRSSLVYYYLLKKNNLDNNIILNQDGTILSNTSILSFDIDKFYCKLNYIISEGEGNELFKELKPFIEKYKILTRMEDKLRMICETNLSKEASEQIESMVELAVRNYLSLGKDKLRACGYQHLKKLITSHTNKLSIDLDSIIYSNFKEGDRFTNKELKTKITSIYSSNGITDAAKASDINKWFTTKDYNPRINGKQQHGLELIKRKS